MSAHQMQPIHDTDPAPANAARLAMRCVALEAELDVAHHKIARVESLCDTVRTLHQPDPDTGDRTVSFFALLDALDPDDGSDE